MPIERSSTVRTPDGWARGVRVVLFDLDNTLYDHVRASREALVEAARGFEETAALEGEELCREFTRHNDECWALAVRGEMTRDELALLRFRRTLAGFGVDRLEAERIELMKPRPEPFLAALEALRVSPREALYVGNSLAVDVAGGAAVGLWTCWFHPAGTPAEAAPRPDLLIRRLEELPDLLRVP